MGYTVTYGPIRAKKRQKWPLIIMSGLFFGLFCACAQHFWAEDLRILREILLPNDAIDDLIRDLQEGESITQAVSAFCENMLHGR